MELNLRKPFLSSQRWMHCIPKDEDFETIQVLARTEVMLENVITSSAPSTTSITHVVFTLLATILSFFLI